MGDAAAFQTGFLTGPWPCIAAADTNNDNILNIADAVGLWNFIVGDAPPLAPPGPENCGLDPDGLFIQCAAYDTCDVPTGLPATSDQVLRTPPRQVTIEETFTLPVFFDEYGFTPLMRTQAISFGICHDPLQLDLVGVELGIDSLTATFCSIQLLPEGWAAVLVDGAGFLGVGNELFVATYQPLGLGFTQAVFCDAPTTPPIWVSVGEAQSYTEYQGYRPHTLSPAIIVNPVPTFVRGDANGDALVDIADPVFILATLFSGGDRSGCEDSADANDDGLLDIADPIAVLNFLFAGGAVPLPAPAGCGVDPTDDPFGCEAETCP